MMSYRPPPLSLPLPLNIGTLIITFIMLTHLFPTTHTYILCSYIEHTNTATLNPSAWRDMPRVRKKHDFFSFQHTDVEVLCFPAVSLHSRPYHTNGWTIHLYIYCSCHRPTVQAFERG